MAALLPGDDVSVVPGAGVGAVTGEVANGPRVELGTAAEAALDVGAAVAGSTREDGDGDEVAVVAEEGLGEGSTAPAGAAMPGPAIRAAERNTAPIRPMS
jgi:hypothetical protein